MLTTSHAYWTWRARRGRRACGWAVLGAVVPDLPAMCAVAVLRARGRSAEALLDAAYHGPGLAQLHMAVHSLLAPAALSALTARAPRALFAGWLAHLLVDYATHARDAWPPAWPLNRRRFPSPVSYWEPDRHARTFSAIETTALVAAASRDRGLRRAAGLAAATLAAAPALAPAGQSMWSAAGARPDSEARGRDLGEDPGWSRSRPGKPRGRETLSSTGPGSRVMGSCSGALVALSRFAPGSSRRGCARG